MCKKPKQTYKQNKKKTPTRTKNQPKKTPPQKKQHKKIINTLLFKTLNKIRLYILFWCSIWFNLYLDMLAWWSSGVFFAWFYWGFIIFFCTVQASGECVKFGLSMLWIWNNICKIYKTICLNCLAMEDLCFMGDAINKMEWWFKQWKTPKWSHRWWIVSRWWVKVGE